MLNPATYVGRAPEQVNRFVEQVVEPMRRRFAESLAVKTAKLRV